MRINLFTFFLLTQLAFAQTTYVPDDNFEQALIDLGYDDTLDDSVLTANISDVTSLDVSYEEISDLTGIAGFTAITILDCNYNSLTSLDLSSNTALTELHCSFNQLTSLDVTNNTALTYLNLLDQGHSQIGMTTLTSLDVTNNTALTYLNTANAGLTSLYSYSFIPLHCILKNNL